MLPSFIAIESMSMDAVVAATKTMLKVAHTDGVHPAEVALIQRFYSGCADSAKWPAFDQVMQDSRGDFHVDAKAFASERERETIVALCVMTGFADGAFSAAEHAAVRSIASDLKVTQERLDAISEAVKDNMLAQLSHLPDAGSVAKVAKELD